MSLPTLEEAEQAITLGKRIGSGAFRNVYRLNTSKWVYKVDHNKGDTDFGTNSAEIKNFYRLCDILSSGNVRIPKMQMLSTGVIAAEYIEGRIPEDCFWLSSCECKKDDLIDGECWYKVTTKILRFKIADVQPSNVRIVDNVVYVIDLGA